MADDQMIEIGDPTEDSTPEPASPRVVIQYHERGGVPWMLLPPLLVLSAVAAVLLYTKLGPRPDPLALVRSTRSASPIVVEASEPTVPTTPTATPPATNAQPEAVTPPEAIVLPSDPPQPPPTPPVVVKESDTPPLSRVNGLGFDPKALEADRQPEAPADAAIAPAVRQDRPEDVDKPREVDPDLLPPDPREARLRQQQRRVEGLKKVENDRARFHADLMAICRKFREDSGPEIRDLTKQYDIRIEPQSEKKAGFLLGKTGPFAGADRRTRVEVLRSLGFPEPVILDDLYLNYEKKLIGERDGPRTPAEAYYRTALALLKCPPTPPVPTGSRSISTTREQPSPRTRTAP